jgi:SAM-dependent methyltransferase
MPLERVGGLKQHRDAQRRKACAKTPRKAPYLGDQALALLLREGGFVTVLDVGCGAGAQARVLCSHGKLVTTLSFERYGDFEPNFVGDFFDFPTDRRFDLVWCSHALEHQPNTRLFLQRLASFVKPGGLLAITVPPGRPHIVGGHLSVWNAGLLLYNLVTAGIDCRMARVRSYGYNVSVIVRPRPALLPPLRHDEGDIERLAHFFPLPVWQGFDGRIDSLHWDSLPDVGPPVPNIAQLRRMEPAATSDLALLGGVARHLDRPGHVLEFGVFHGRSIRVLAEALPLRVIHGFDSFTGLPAAWQRSVQSTYEAGHFHVHGLPAVPDNVCLWPGWFDASLPAWLQRHDGPVALVHVDCDLCESAATVLDLLDGRIVDGTLLVFDELCDWARSGVYACWRDGEWKALCAWLAGRGRQVRALARGPSFSALFEVIGNPPAAV